MWKLVLLSILVSSHAGALPLCEWSAPDENKVVGNNMGLIDQFDTITTLDDCKVECEKASTCKSIDWMPKTLTFVGACRMYSILGTGAELEDNTGYDHYIVGQCPPEAEEPGLCLCYGDPHCYRYDQDKALEEMFLEDKSCWYTLTQDACQEAYLRHTFYVAANLRKVKENMRRSYVEEVKIYYNFDHVILSQFTRNVSYLINYNFGVREAPFNDGGFEVTIEDPNTLPGIESLWHNNPPKVMVVAFPNVRVLWDMYKEVKIVADASLKGTLCGLCGNFDAVDDADDMVLGNHLHYREKPCEAMQAHGHFGRPTTNMYDFVASWFRAMDNDEEACYHECRHG